MKIGFMLATCNIIFLNIFNMFHISKSHLLIELIVLGPQILQEAP